MRKIITLILYTQLIACILSGCKSSLNPESSELKPVPDSFLRKDSSNSANIRWKDYFSDTTLSHLIDTALKNNFDALKAMQRIEGARAGVRFANGALLPTVTGYTSIAQRRFGLYTMDGAGNITTDITPGQIVPVNLPDYYIGLQSSWEADVWGKLRNRKKAALARYLSSLEGRNFVITNLIAEVATTYYDLLALDNELEIIQETLKLQNEALELIRIQKQAGVANELGVKQFEAQVLNSGILEKETLQSITETENRINFLLGRYPQPIVRNKSVFSDTILSKFNVGVPSDLLKNRPDIRQAEHELIASKADVKAARAAFYPSLNIVGAFGFQAFKTTYLFTAPQSIAYTALGSLTAPLINRNAIRAEFKTANAIQQEALYDYQESIINGYIEVYNEMARINRLTEIHLLASTEVNVLNTTIEASTELYKSGRATYLEVLLAQKNTLDAKLHLTDVKRRQYFAQVNIYKALGGGWQ